jgi:hypothetical protein
MSSFFRLGGSKADANDSADAAATDTPATKASEAHPLDALTGGAFSAATSGERAARIREWLASQPSAEQMQEVFKELSAKDKGAAKPLREKLDELKRARNQEAIAAEWAARAQALLDQAKLNIADAMAWQRDAAKAGAPLSREPLAGLRARLTERVKSVEDLQNRVQVHREAAVLLAQRIEILSTKPWQDAQAAHDALAADVQAWRDEADAIAAHANWSSVDAKFPGLLDASRGQLVAVWSAFDAALAQAVAAAQDATVALPPVPLWADEIRAHRAPDAASAEAGEGAAVAKAAKPAAPRATPEERAAAAAAVQGTLEALKKELAEGHGKASMSAANALRQALREHGRLLEPALEAEVHGALAAAGELEGWQRWRADQLREELVVKAEGLLKRPEGQGLGGRKMQETLRHLREEWKATDQGGVPNHGLWKRFDEACNLAHKVVEDWLEKVRADAAANRAQRLALIEEVKAWAATPDSGAGQERADWKGIQRTLHGFSERWREAGHLGEKAYAELQPQWKDVIHAAHAPLEAAQQHSLEQRRAMTAEAAELGAAPQLRIDAVKALQMRWQEEAKRVPLDRKLEQKLWDAFRKPIDDAFNRKTAEREKAAAALSERDRAVLEASKALEAANASGDAQRIHAALAALEAALRGQPAAPAAPVAPRAAAEPAKGEPATADAAPADTTPADAAPADTASADAASADAAPAEAASAEPSAEPTTEAPAAPAPAPAPAAPVVRKVVAVRGDDRPGAKRAEPASTGRDGRPGGRPGERQGGRPGGRDARPGDRRDGRPGGGDRFGGPRAGDRFSNDRFSSAPREDARGPRLGDVAFRAQRDAMDHAQAALRKLAAQAHGEVLTQLMGAWQTRQADQVPPAQQLGRGVPPQARVAWTQALGQAAAGAAPEALLRLEMAADLPSPAEHQDARRALQLQLLTRRGEATPEQTWTQDVARVLAGAHEDASARRLQNALKALMRGADRR